MKWVPFCILAVVTLVCQTTIVQAMAIQTIWPNWMFVLAVFYALWGNWPDAAIAAWLLGLAVDLQTAGGAGHIGLYAFLFGGSAWVILKIRGVFIRDHVMTFVMVALVFSLAVELLVEVVRHWDTLGQTSKATLWWPAFFTALYTAVWARCLHWPLNRLRPWMGLGRGRRR